MKIAPISCAAPSFAKNAKPQKKTTVNTDYPIQASDVLPATAILGAGLLTVYFMKKGEIYNCANFIK